jgi:chromosome segregation ATPase
MSYPDTEKLIADAMAENAGPALFALVRRTRQYHKLAETFEARIVELQEGYRQAMQTLQDVQAQRQRTESDLANARTEADTLRADVVRLAALPETKKAQAEQLRAERARIEAELTRLEA